MIAPYATRTMTADEFLLIDNKGFELVEGVIKGKNMGFFSASVELWIFELICSRFNWRAYGVFAGSEGGFQCWADFPNRVRKPDISFVRKERIPAGEKFEGWCPLAPDFVIEVMSKNDTLAEQEEKIEEYFAAGVPVAWIVDPKRREVYVYEGSLSANLRTGSDVIEHPNVLPGFRCTAEELFPPE